MDTVLLGENLQQFLSQLIFLALFSVPYFFLKIQSVLFVTSTRIIESVNQNQFLSYGKVHYKLLSC